MLDDRCAPYALELNPTLRILHAYESKRATAVGAVAASKGGSTHREIERLPTPRRADVARWRTRRRPEIDRRIALHDETSPTPSDRRRPRAREHDGLEPRAVGD